MKLSVIIPTRSRYNNLVKTLTALKDQSLKKEEYEVIVVDDNSTDQTNSIVASFKDGWNFKYIFSNVPKPHTWNASIIRNMGALLSSQETEALVFVDSDVVLPRNALELYLIDFEANKDRVIIGYYDFLREDGTVAVQDVRHVKFETVTPEQTFEQVHDGLACFGGNILIPKNIFWSVGGFDTDVHIGLEDGSMGLKLWKKKTKFSYDNRIIGKHSWHDVPTDRFPPNMNEHINNLNLKHFHTKNPDYGIIEMSRETYASWGFENWQEPLEWKRNQLDFIMKIKKED